MLKCWNIGIVSSSPIIVKIQIYQVCLVFVKKCSLSLNCTIEGFFCFDYVREAGKFEICDVASTDWSAIWNAWFNTYLSEFHPEQPWLIEFFLVRVSPPSKSRESFPVHRLLFPTVWGFWSKKGCVWIAYFSYKWKNSVVNSNQLVLDLVWVNQNQPFTPKDINRTQTIVFC